MIETDPAAGLLLNYPHERFGRSYIVQADCFEWMGHIAESSLHGIVTDPPYGIKEYQAEQIEKRENGKGGVWRIPPSFDGANREPLPRFTALNSEERATLTDFFTRWAALSVRVLRPGGHVLIASNAFISQLTFSALVDGGLEFRGEIIRLVRTLRGGNRPKNAEDKYPGVSSMLRGGYEPWGVFRKPLPKGMTVADCLAQFQTGALRRRPDGKPFSDVIESERTPASEKEIANHPSLKPQSLMRQLVYIALPLGKGILADPFMGAGSTIAASQANGVQCVGVEDKPFFYEMARAAVPALAGIDCKSSWPPSSCSRS